MAEGVFGPAANDSRHLRRDLPWMNESSSHIDEWVAPGQ